MTNKIKIAVDAMGGDNSPQKVLNGIGISLKTNKNNFFYLFGNEKIIKKEIDKIENIKKYCEIINTEEVILDNESPLVAAKRGKGSSMWKAIESQKEKITDISLSAGNTGALLVISRLILNTIKGINKPALAGLWPNQNDMNVVLDLGANIECDEKNLIDFSEMGAALFKSIFPDQKPYLSLLNIGSEEIKGTEMLKKAFARLKELSNEENFIFKGYIEGNNLMEGDTNVIITDGFTGNVALKTAEGTAKFLTDSLKKSLTENIFSKFSIIFSYFSLKKFKSKLDPRKYNGAIFLGLNGPVVKSHGSTDSVGFYHSIDLCYKIIKGNLMGRIKSNLNHLNVKD